MDAEVYNQSTFIILKAAYLYYLKDKAQNEIADILNISVPTVSRLIKKAKEEKIVEFVIRDPYLECIDLEENLKKEFKLKDVVIAPLAVQESSQNDMEENLKKLVALEGARYLQRIITEEDVLGISWGQTMYHLIHYLNPCQKVNGKFVTMHGSISSLKPDLDVRTLVSRTSMVFGGKNYSLMAEALLSNAETAASIKKEKHVKKVYEMFDKITISISGMGSFFPQLDSLLCKSDYLTAEEINTLQKNNVVGDIVLRFFDKNGQECATNFRDRTIGIELEQFKQIKTKISVVSGEVKTHTVLAALKGGFVDVLITDYNLVKSILKLNASK
ncbi:MAG: sugar-binding transcriptional regulator [Peptococcia bacterium]|jgi:deoxyribonucleoside regulator